MDLLAYTGDLQDTSTPLLKIRVYSAKDYHDNFTATISADWTEGIV